MAKDETPLVMQRTRNECALACLAMVADWYSLQKSLGNIRSLHAPADTGMTLNALMRVADEMGLGSTAMSYNPEELSKLTRPSILHWNFNHYVVFWRVEIEYGVPIYLISDPARGRQRLLLSMLANYFSGVAVNLFPRNENLGLEVVC